MLANNSQQNSQNIQKNIKMRASSMSIKNSTVDENPCRLCLRKLKKHEKSSTCFIKIDSKSSTFDENPCRCCWGEIKNSEQNHYGCSSKSIIIKSSTVYEMPCRFLLQKNTTK